MGSNCEMIILSQLIIIVSFCIGTAVTGGTFGRGQGQIWLDNIECDGDELNLEECTHAGWGSHDCGHNEDAGVRCSE